MRHLHTVYIVFNVYSQMLICRLSGWDFLAIKGNCKIHLKIQHSSMLWGFWCIIFVYHTGYIKRLKQSWRLSQLENVWLSLDGLPIKAQRHRELSTVVGISEFPVKLMWMWTSPPVIVEDMYTKTKQIPTAPIMFLIWLLQFLNTLILFYKVYQPRQISCCCLDSGWFV